VQLGWFTMEIIMLCLNNPWAQPSYHKPNVGLFRQMEFFRALCRGTNYCIHVSHLMIFMLLYDFRTKGDYFPEHYSPVSLCIGINTVCLRGRNVISIHNYLLSILNGLTQ
jgi:hypothetical protein